MGPDIISCLVSETNNGSDKFYKALRDVHDHLKGKSRKQETVAVETDYLVIDNELMPINDIEIILSNCDNIIDEILENQDINKSPQLPTVETSEIKKGTAAVETDDSVIGNELMPINDIDANYNDINEMIENPDMNKFIEMPKTVNTETPAKLKDTLSWAQTPQRKGKIIDHNPTFVLTSRRWLEIEENKKNEKEIKEKEKENRKKKRAEKKKQAEKCVTKTTKNSKTSKNVQENNEDVRKINEKREGDENRSKKKEEGTKTDGKDLKELDLIKAESDKKTKKVSYNNFEIKKSTAKYNGNETENRQHKETYTKACFCKED